MTAEANGPAGEGQPTTAPEATVIAGQGSNGDVGIKVAGPLTDDNRTLVETKEWMKDGSIDLNALADGYRNFEIHSRQTVKVPGENATADDWNAFYGKLGRPETPDKYELKLNTEAVPEGFPYDEKSAIEFRTWAHEAGLTPAQAQTLHDKFVGVQAGGFTAARDAMAKAEGDTHREIVMQWGDPDTDGYKQNLEYTSRAIGQLGLKDELTRLGALSVDGAVLSPKIAFALSKVGKEMYGEDTTVLNAGGTISNPFSAEHENLTQQGQLVRDDPSKARSLIRAAGGNPADYGL